LLLDLDPRICELAAVSTASAGEWQRIQRVGRHELLCQIRELTAAIHEANDEFLLRVQRATDLEQGLGASGALWRQLAQNETAIQNVGEDASRQKCAITAELGAERAVLRECRGECREMSG
jgi:hypothetical protein